MRILIMAEGGYRIGMGHIMRMLVLADRLKEFAEVIFVCRDKEEFQGGIRHIEACGYTVLRVGAIRFFGELTGIDGDCLITDSYDVDESYFADAKANFAITGYMDDLNNREINADFIINQNIYAEDLKYKEVKDTRLYLGTKYALLREEFCNIQKKSIRNNMEDVLVTLGGADPLNLTEAIALKLSSAFFQIRFHIVAGPLFTHGDNLRKIAGGNIILHENPVISELMLKCDGAISACGSTIYELFACGTPTIGIVAADNQKPAARIMASMELLKHAGDTDEIIEHLKSMDYVTRCRMSEMGQSRVDGWGSLRLALEIKGIIKEII